jgi:hypothetical protein
MATAYLHPRRQWCQIIDSNDKIGDFPSSNFTTIIGGGTGNFPVCIHCAFWVATATPELDGRSEFVLLYFSPPSADKDSFHSTTHWYATLCAITEYRMREI